MNVRMIFCLLVPAWLSACGPADFNLGGPAPDEAVYDRLFPYYVEDCAVSELRKKPGFGFEYSGGTGGHSVAFLNGVCRDPDAQYPVVRMCPAGTPPDEAGTGISANSHFSNANWVAIQGRGFFFGGGLPPGAPLTRAAYERTQAEAKARHLYEGVVFHPAFFADKKPGWSDQDWRYEISVATDYALDFGRGRYCTRVPVNGAQMERVVAYLNGLNDLYRHGPRVYRWDVLEDNCSHLVHNALAAAGVWPLWPTHMPVIAAALDFPVPRNEFVNLARRTNDLPLDDLDALFADPTVRAEVLRDGFVPTEPGALAAAFPPRTPNAVYDTELQLIFYDEPTIGSYATWFDRIFAQPRYTDMTDDLRHFAALYDRIEARRQPLGLMLSRRWAWSPQERTQFALFYTRYYAIVARERARLEDARMARASLTRPAASGIAGDPAAAHSQPGPPATSAGRRS